MSPFIPLALRTPPETGPAGFAAFVVAERTGACFELVRVLSDHSAQAQRRTGGAA